jgi:hypothetical protein
MPSILERLSETNVKYPQPYIDQLFTIWYSMGKPAASSFSATMPPYDDGITKRKPALQTVQKWIIDIFVDRGKVLDDQVMNQINQRLVADKVEMLNRHAELGFHIQNMALEYLDGNKDKLNVSNSVRLLVEGVRIERESRGISTTLEKITNMSDEELEKQVRQLVERSPVDLLPMDIIDADSEFEQEVDS